jgi:hypothetical protein
VLRVGQRSYCGHTPAQHEPLLPRRQPQHGVPVIAFLDQGTCRASGARQLATRPGSKLHIVDRHAHGNVGQGQGVARLNGRVRPTLHRVARGRALWREDVGVLLPEPAFHPGVTYEGNTSRAVGVVFNAFHTGSGRAGGTFEVYEAVDLAMTATSVPGGDTAVVVAAAGLAEALCEGLEWTALPKVFARCDDAAAQTRGGGFVNLEAWTAIDAGVPLREGLPRSPPGGD